MSDCENKFSRRKIIKFMAVGATVPILNSLIGQVQAAKASKESMQYRDKPNGKEHCSNCMQFVPASSECRVVEGSISPNGWCVAYTKKS